MNLHLLDTAVWNKIDNAIAIVCGIRQEGLENFMAVKWKEWDYWTEIKVLYYAVWIRYFVGGREIALLNRAFLFVPMPLVVFPMLYFLCAAVWLHNLPAVILMTIFGAAHLTVSIQSFR